jgi:hypothetical protein
MADSGGKIAIWRVILAAVLDFLSAFYVFGFLLALVAGETKGASFALEGGPVFLLFALIFGYFWLGRRSGGTLWQRILKAR